MTAPTLTLDQIKALEPHRMPPGLPKKGGITAARFVKAGGAMIEFLEIVDCLKPCLILQRGEMFAADCIVRALDKNADKLPNEDRIYNAIIARRKHAMGEINVGDYATYLSAALIASQGAENDATADVAFAASMHALSDAAWHAWWASRDRPPGQESALEGEGEWQFKRFLEWFSDAPPEPLPLPPLPEAA